MNLFAKTTWLSINNEMRCKEQSATKVAEAKVSYDGTRRLRDKRLPRSTERLESQQVAHLCTSSVFYRSSLLYVVRIQRLESANNGSCGQPNGIPARTIDDQGALRSRLNASVGIITSRSSTLLILRYYT